MKEFKHSNIADNHICDGVLVLSANADTGMTATSSIAARIIAKNRFIMISSSNCVMPVPNPMVGCAGHGSVCLICL